MTDQNTSTMLPVNRTYKSTIFIMLFEDRNNLLELYNAVSGKNYEDPFTQIYLREQAYFHTFPAVCNLLQ